MPEPQTSQTEYIQPLPDSRLLTIQGVDYLVAKVALAAGGFGSVFKAQRLNPDGSATDVAIKVAHGPSNELRKRFADPHNTLKDQFNSAEEIVEQMLYREAEVMALAQELTPGGVVLGLDYISEEITDFIDHQAIVMEWMDPKYEQTAEQLLEKNPNGLSFAISTHIMDQVAVVLDGLAQKGNVLMLDATIRNIFVNESLDYRAKLADFGLTAEVGGKQEQATGTANFMAPEMFKLQQLTNETLVYMMAMNWYQLLTGQPYTGVKEDNPLAGLQAAHAHLRGLNTTNPDALAASREFAIKYCTKAEMSDASADLVCRVFEFATQRQPANRYPDCSSFMLALKAASAAEPALLTPADFRPAVENAATDDREQETTPFDVDAVYQEAANQTEDDTTQPKPPAPTGGRSFF